MELRQRMQIHIPLVQAEFADRIHRVQEQIAMSQHHSLAPARSPRCVEYCPVFFLTYFRRRRSAAPCLCKQRFIVQPVAMLAGARTASFIAGDDEMLDACEAGPYGFYQMLEPLFDHDHARPSV